MMSSFGLVLPSIVFCHIGIASLRIVYQCDRILFRNRRYYLERSAKNNLADVS